MMLLPFGGTPRPKQTQDCPPGRLQLAGKSLEGADLLTPPSPLPRLVIVSVVCSQVKTFCGEQSVLEVL